jgi:ribosomal protein S18 acetylase RimI-like enzyme
MNIRYIPYRDEFREDLPAMIKSLYSDDPYGDKMNDEKIEATVNFFQAHPDHGKILLITGDGIVMGYAIIVYFWSNEYGGAVILLDELFIRSEFRGKSIGTGFVRNLISTESGRCKAIFLEVVPSNGRALEFYQKIGFQLHKNKFHRYLLNNQD